MTKVAGTLQLVVHSDFRLDMMILGTGGNDHSTPIDWQISRIGSRRDHATCFSGEGRYQGKALRGQTEGAGGASRDCRAQETGDFMPEECARQTVIACSSDMLNRRPDRAAFLSSVVLAQFPGARRGRQRAR